MGQVVDYFYDLFFFVVCLCIEGNFFFRVYVQVELYLLIGFCGEMFGDYGVLGWYGYLCVVVDFGIVFKGIGIQVYLVVMIGLYVREYGIVMVVGVN